MDRSELFSSKVIIRAPSRSKTLIARPTIRPLAVWHAKWLFGSIFCYDFACKHPGVTFCLQSEASLAFFFSSPDSRLCPAFFAWALSSILLLITLRCVFRDSLTLQISVNRHNFADAPFLVPCDPPNHFYVLTRCCLCTQTTASEWISCLSALRISNLW